MDSKIVIPIVVGIIIVIVGIISIIISIVAPNRRLWPPPSRNSWQFYILWGGFYYICITFILLGILNWNSSNTLLLLRIISGVSLLVAGSFIFTWGVATLKINRTLGLKGNKIISTGPYKFMRNPQYLGIFIFIGGFMILTSSILILISGILGIILFMLSPFSEEPWLRQQYGKDYIDYCNKVRRFI